MLRIISRCCGGIFANWGLELRMESKKPGVAIMADMLAIIWGFCMSDDKSCGLTAGPEGFPKFPSAAKGFPCRGEGRDRGDGSLGAAGIAGVAGGACVTGVTAAGGAGGGPLTTCILYMRRQEVRLSILNLVKRKSLCVLEDSSRVDEFEICERWHLCLNERFQGKNSVCRLDRKCERGRVS